MLFKRQEKKRMNPWCAIMVGGLAVVGAVSIVTACKDTIMEKSRAIASLFHGRCKSRTGTTCEE